MNLQLLIDKEQNILRNNTLFVLDRGSKKNDEIPSSTNKKIDFLFCPSCFWCASFINFGEVAVIRCPNCYNGFIDQQPINNTEPERT